MGGDRDGIERALRLPTPKATALSNLKNIHLPRPNLGLIRLPTIPY
jgi:hypothetical protein